MQKGKPVSIHKFEAPIRAIALSADEKLMAVSLNNGVTSLHETSPWKLVKTVSTKPRTFTALTFSPDGKALVGGYGGRDVAIFEVKSLAIQYTIEGINKAKPFFLNPRELVVGSQSRKVEIYDIGSLQQIASISEAEKPTDYAVAGDQIVFLNHKGIRSQKMEADNFLFTVDIRPAPKVISLSPNQQSIATSGLDGEIQIWDIASDDADPLGIPSHDLASEERSFTMIPEESYMLQNLVGNYQRFWQERSDAKGAFQWTNEGLDFSAGSLVEHMTGHDALYLPIQIGTKPFDLRWEVKVDRNQGHSQFNPGICIGLTTGLPGRMHEEDVTFSISTQYAGLYPGILRGEPYYRQPNYSNMANFSHTNLTRGGEVPVIKYDHHIKSFIGLDRSLFQSIRRDGLGNLTFKAWLPSLGQTEHNPWWTRSLVLKEHGEKELKCLMIKRIPLLASHLGGWGVGYDVFETTGRIPYLAMRPNPPKVTSIEWEDTVLKSGDTVTFKGTGLAGNPIVKIGDLEVQKTRPKSNQEMTFQLPKIKSGKTYDLLVRNAG